MPTVAQIQAFKTAFKLSAKDTNRWIRWETPTGCLGFMKTQTSLAPVVAAMDAFEQSATQVNLDKVHKAMKALPTASKEKYADALSELGTNLKSAQTILGDEWIAQIDQNGDLEQHLRDHMDGLIAGNAANLEAGLKAIGGLKNSTNKRYKKAAATIAKELANKSLEAPKAAGPSRAARDASRTPNDVLVHLMLEVNKALKDHANDGPLKQLAARGRNMFMTHQLDSSTVQKLIRDTKLELQRLNEAKAAAVCDALASQLPGDDASLAPAQLQDNIYGRVFDSKLVAELVEHPPARMLDGAKKSGVAFAAMLADNSTNRKAAKKLRDSYLSEVRPWTGAVPGLSSIKSANDDDVLTALTDFLKTPPTTGQGIIAHSFLMTKMAICQQNCGSPPDFMKTAGKNYGTVIKPQASRDRAATAEKVLSDGAGITLLHQPIAVDSDSVELSERPTTVNRFNQRKHPNNMNRGLEEDIRSDAVVVQHEHALPFASGVSGSTNILLHMY